VYIVPGNHDLKRNKLTELLIDGIISNPEPKKAINELDQESLSQLVQGQKSFFKFYKDFLGEDYPEDSLHFVKKMDGFNIIHINACLVAAKKSMEGKILIGLDRLYQTLRTLPNDDSINIAIGHYGFDWTCTYSCIF
ncbi:hypothetical protein BSO21_32610, partial [Paenibacillus odorifer]